MGEIMELDHKDYLALIDRYNPTTKHVREMYAFCLAKKGYGVRNTIYRLLQDKASGYPFFMGNQEEYNLEMQIEKSDATMRYIMVFAAIVFFVALVKLIFY
jgi:hypothetical protein